MEIELNIEITEIGGTGELNINNFVFNEDNKTGILSAGLLPVKE